MNKKILQIPPSCEIEIRQAEAADLDGVKALLRANHVDNLTEEQKADGFVTTNMTDAQMRELSAMKTGITIASDRGKVVAFAFAAAWEYWKQWPFFVNMIGELPKYHYLGQELSTENSYQYGPVCVDRAYRGQGIFETLFQASLEGMSDRFPVMVTFVNHKNPRSHAAHTKKAKMDVLGDFDYNGNSYYLLACATKRAPGTDGFMVIQDSDRGGRQFHDRGQPPQPSGDKVLGSRRSDRSCGMMR